MVLTEDGGKKELPLVRVLADQPFWDSGRFSRLLHTVPGYDQDFHVEFELLREEPARSQRIESLRVEVMAGRSRPGTTTCSCPWTSTLRTPSLWTSTG